MRFSKASEMAISCLPLLDEMMVRFRHVQIPFVVLSRKLVDNSGKRKRRPAFTEPPLPV